MLSYRERKSIAEIEALRKKLDATAQEKPRGPRWWSFFNSPFGIWLLSAVVIGFFGTVWSDFQSCKSQAASLSDQFNRLSIEVSYREARLFKAIEQAQTPEALIEAASYLGGPNVPYRYLEFKDRTLADLEDQYDLLRAKLLPPTASLLGQIKLEFSSGDFSSDFAKVLSGNDKSAQARLGPLFEAEANFIFNRMLTGEEVDLKLAKEVAQLLVHDHAARRMLDVFLATGGQCSMWHSVKDRVSF